jgi:hypothetical protein
MKKQFIFAVTVIVALATSAFIAIDKKPQVQKHKTTSDLVWFAVHPTLGTASNPSYGIRGDNPPAGLDCTGSTYYCARALSISQNEVVLNGDNETYSIAQGVNITTSYNAEAFKN